MDIPDFGDAPEGLLAQEVAYVKNFKKAMLLVAGAAVQKLQATFAKEQEILMAVADMGIWTYLAESVVLRTQKLATIKSEDEIQEQIAMARTYVYDVADLINKAAKDALNSFAEGDEHRMMLMGIKRFTKVAPVNVKETRRKIADALIEKNAYCF